MSQEGSRVSFSGNASHKLDAKSRVSVLANWLDNAGSEFQLLDAKKKGYEVIKCYTRKSFADMIDYIRRKAEELDATPMEIDEYVGDIIGSSYEGEANAQGKMLIPKKQRERLRLTDTAVLVGRGEYFEIWNPTDFEASQTSASPGRGKLAAHFGTLG